MARLCSPEPHSAHENAPWLEENKGFNLTEGTDNCSKSSKTQQGSLKVSDMRGYYLKCPCACKREANEAPLNKLFHTTTEFGQQLGGQKGLSKSVPKKPQHRRARQDAFLKFKAERLERIFQVSDLNAET